MPTPDRIMAFDRRRATARRYRKRHPSPETGERLLAAAAIEARAGHRILRARLERARTTV